MSSKNLFDLTGKVALITGASRASARISLAPWLIMVPT